MGSRACAALSVATAMVLCLPTSGWARGARPNPLPMRLPSASAARAAVAGDWLLGARPGTIADGIARRHEARRIAPGTYRVPIARARAMAAELRRAGALRYAE